MKRKSPGKPDTHKEGKPGSEEFANPDLFLSEEALVRLAMRELNGRLPPGFGRHFRDRGDEAEAAQVARGGVLHGGRKTVLAHELDMRGWTPRDLAEAAELTPAEALALTRGNQRITPDIARRLARVFATSEEFWL